MNTAFPEALGGTTTSTASPFLINGTLPYAADPNTQLTGIFEGDYFIRYADNVTVGFESGYGSYDASTDSLTVIKVYQSSNGPDVAATFTSAVKHFGFVLSGNVIGAMARTLIALEPHEDILIGSSGQSNAGHYTYYDGATPATNANVLDWSTTGAGGALGWRTVVKADNYTDYTPTTAYIGTPRSVFDVSWRACGSIVHGMAVRLAQITGRKVRTINVYRPATGISDPVYGWGYSTTTTTLVSRVFKDAVVDAIAALPANQSSITKLHIYLFSQGENDAAGTTVPSGTYGNLLAEHMAALEAPEKWGVAGPETRYILMDIPCRAREIESFQPQIATFDGHAVAQSIVGSRCVVVPTQGAETRYDQTHYIGEAADMLGARAADTMITTTTAGTNYGGAFRSIPNKKWPTTAYIWESDSASAPASTKFRFNAGRTTIKFNYVPGGGGSNLSAAGLGLFKKNDRIRLYQSGTPGIFVVALIGGIATDGGSWFEYPITILSSAGSFTAGPTYILIAENFGWHDGKDYVASTASAILSTKQNSDNFNTLYTEGLTVSPASHALDGSNLHVIIADPTGKQFRSRQLGTKWGKLRTTNATANQALLDTAHFAEGRVEFVKATVCYKVPANGNVGVFEVRGVVRMTGTATLDWSAVTVIVDEEALATDPNIVSTSFAGVFEGWIIRVTGKASTNIDWVCAAEIIEIPTST